MENNLFDKLIQGSVEKYEVPFNPSDWDDLEQRLDKNKIKTKHLFLTKGIELLLLTLVVFTSYQLLSDKLQLDSSASTHDTTVSSSPKGDKAGHSAANVSTLNDVNINALPSTNQSTGNTEALDKPSTSASEATNFGSARFIEQERLNASSEKMSSYEYVKSILPTSSLPASSSPSQSQADISTSASPLASDEDMHSPFYSEGISTILNLVIPDYLQEPLVVPEYLRKPRPPQKFKGEQSWAVVIAPEVNINPNPHSVQAPSVGFAFGLQYQKQLTPRLYLETGLNYNIKKFFYDKIVTYNNDIPYNTNNQFYKEEASKLSNLSLIEIPVNVKYDFLQTRTLKIYGLGGFTAGLLLHNQQQRNIDLFTNPQEDMGIKMDDNLRLPNENALLQGGTAAGNILSSINLGAGLEYTANPITSVFVQPMYRIGLNEAGATKSKLSAVSIQLGLRFNLEGKK